MEPEILNIILSIKRQRNFKFWAKIQSRIPRELDQTIYRIVYPRIHHQSLNQFQFLEMKKRPHKKVTPILILRVQPTYNWAKLGGFFSLNTIEIVASYFDLLENIFFLVITALLQ